MHPHPQLPDYSNLSIDELRKELHRRDWSRRLNAAKRLGDRGTQAVAAVQDLVLLLTDQNETVLGTAIIALSKIKPSSQNVVQPLIKLVLCTSESISRMACHTITKLVPVNAYFLPALIKAVNKSGLFNRCRIITLLGDLGSHASIAYPELFQLTQQPLAEDFAFIYALEALNNIKLPRTQDLEKIYNLLKDSVGRLHLFSLPPYDENNNIIVNHVLPLFEELIDKYYALHYQIIMLIVSSQIGGDEIIHPLIRSLNHPNKLVKSYSAECLGQIGPEAHEAIPSLVLAIRDAHPEVRLFAVEALGSIGAMAYHAIPALTELTHDPDPVLREYALTAINKIHAHTTN